MAVYLSPGVFSNEIDLSVIPNATGPLRPAFIGTAKKGPLNQAILITTSQQYINTYGEPFSESYLGYAVLAYLEEGNQCYVMRVGIECEDGQADALADICIDTSGARGTGWGRIPLFTGIDYGRINLREVDSDHLISLHSASVTTPAYNDVDVSSTHGATTASMAVTGTYTGAIDDSFIMIITSPPDVSAGSSIGGAGYQMIRNSDGEVISSGTLNDDKADGISNLISIGSGLTVQVTVTSGVLDTNDTFSFTVAPNNRVFSISVEGAAATTHTMPVANHATVAAFVAAFNALVGSEQYLMVAYTLADGVTTIPQLRTKTAGERIQIMSTEGWALEVGVQLYEWDIPRSYLLGVDAGPFDITAQNNRIKLKLIGVASSQTVEFNIPTGLTQTADSVAASIDVAGIVASDVLWDSFELTVIGGTTHVVIVTSAAHQFDTLVLQANYSNLKTLRFAEQLQIQYPYKRAYRGFSDNRLQLPASGAITASTPLSCEVDPVSADCLSDTAYFANIVGWLVAPSPGTWVDGYTVTVEILVDTIGDSAGRYKLTIKNNAGVVVDVINDVNFDKRTDRYIGNIVNQGSKHGGTNGNEFVNWEERPAFLDNDVSDLTTFDVRLPSQFTDNKFAGQANGIPTDPAYSSDLDAAIIGNQATSTGLYAFQNPEAIDINLLATPGFSSGSVIGTALQLCESRGDVLYIVDPPFGLRPQQIVDWHNGMLLSDLSSAINSSYGALYWGWLRTFDQFSADEIWVPPSGHITAVFSRTAREAEQWFAPAGLRRGKLFTALDVEYSPTQGERDLLYGSGNAVNPIVKFPQDGITVWGQRTLQRTASALDRVNVRMLLISIKKSLIRLLRNYIFEPNDKILWRQVQATINPYLADVQSRRGLQAYKVIVDSTNNTPERMDRGELWVSVFLKPTPVAEYVILNIAVLRNDSSFSAEEVLATAGIVNAATAV